MYTVCWREIQSLLTFSWISRFFIPHFFLTKTTHKPHFLPQPSTALDGISDATSHPTDSLINIDIYVYYAGDESLQEKNNMKKYGDRLGKMADKYYTVMVECRQAQDDEKLNPRERMYAKSIYSVYRQEFLGYWAIRETIRAGYMPVKESE